MKYNSVSSGRFPRRRVFGDQHFSLRGLASIVGMVGLISCCAYAILPTPVRAQQETTKREDILIEPRAAFDKLRSLQRSGWVRYIGVCLRKGFGPAKSAYTAEVNAAYDAYEDALTAAASRVAEVADLNKAWALAYRATLLQSLSKEERAEAVAKANAARSKYELALLAWKDKVRKAIEGDVEVSYQPPGACEPDSTVLNASGPGVFNISFSMGTHSQQGMRTDFTGVDSFGGIARVDARTAGTSSTGLSLGVLATFQPFRFFGGPASLGAVQPIVQVGYFGDLDNTATNYVVGLNAVPMGSGEGSVTTRGSVPILVGFSTPLSSLPLPFELGGLASSTSLQISAGLQISRHAASFRLTELGAPAAAPTTASRGWTSISPTFGFGTMTELSLDTPFGRPVLTNNLLVSFPSGRDLVAQSNGFATEVYRLRVRTGTQFRLMTGIGFSFGGNMTASALP